LAARRLDPPKPLGKPGIDVKCHRRIG
jgi:hypothetical protein